jgi:AraC family transcriptional regulator
MPVHQYVISARVAYALDLVVRTSMPLAEIALQSGFSSQSHLSLHMRRLHGVTPAALRRGLQ